MKRVLKNKTFNETSIGDMAVLKRTFTKQDILLFAAVTGDINPLHIDDEFAKTTRFHEVIAHGMWIGALISTVLGTQLPGPGTIYLSQSIKFIKPICVGDKVTVRVKIIKKYIRKPIIVLSCHCINQRNKTIATGLAKVLAPPVKVKHQLVKLPTIDSIKASSS